MWYYEMPGVSRLMVLHTSAKCHIVVLMCCPGQRRSQATLLDESLSLVRHMGFVQWAADRPGQCTLDVGRQRLYVCSDGHLRTYKIWRSMAAPVAEPAAGPSGVRC